MKMKIALLVLLAVSAAFAQPAPKSMDTFTNMFNANVGLAAILLAISIMLAGAVYMAGNFLMNDKVKEWAKTEAVEIFYSGVILAVIVGICASATGVAESLTRQIDPYSANVACNTDVEPFNYFRFHDKKPVDSGYAQLPCHMRVAKNFLATLFYETAGYVKAVGITHSWYTYLSSFSMDFTPVGTTTFFSGASFSHSILGFLNAKNNALAFLFDNGVKTLTLIRFQEVLMNYIGLALFPVLLAAGLILRAFMLTRKLGGLLMAIALSLYFVYPMFYVWGDSVLTSLKLEYGDQTKPFEERSALGQIFVDLDALPGKLSSDPLQSNTQSEDFKVNPDGDASMQKFLDQMSVLTATGKCKEVMEKQDNPPSEGWLDYWLGYFGTTNPLLGNWLSGAYLKGGIGSFQGINPSFASILVGIDVLAKALFFSVFFSFLSVFATIAAIKTLSPMLGGDVEIAGLTHLI